MADEKKVNTRSVYTAVLGIAVAVAISLVMVTEMDDDGDDPCDDPDYKAADGMPTDDGRLRGELCDDGNESAAEWQERVRKWNRDRVRQLELQDDKALQEADRESDLVNHVRKLAGGPDDPLRWFWDGDSVLGTGGAEHCDH